jgi:hypothetical protein
MTKTFTNRENLPEPIVRAVTNDPYTKGKSDFSVTELLQPPRARALINKHRDEIVEDVADRLFALMGQIGHAILERAGGESLVERRFFAKVATFTISGQADLVITPEGSELIDYKFCSVWTMLNGVKPEWTQQVNILRYLAANDIGDVGKEPIYCDINKANIVAIFRDWSKPKAGREKDYPQSQVKVFPVELWPLEKTEEFICNRIAAHITAEKILPLCTDEERWRTQEKWAVMKEGRKSAVKLYDHKEHAIISTRGESKLYIQHRPGESKRCEFYCNAAPFCTQFQSEKIDASNLGTVELNTAQP